MRTRRPATARECANKRKGGRTSAKRQASVPLKRSVGWYKRLQTNAALPPAEDRGSSGSRLQGGEA